LKSSATPATSTARVTPDEKARVLLVLASTLLIVLFAPSSLAVLLILLPFWWIVFRPWQLGELYSFVIATIFFLIQNYVCLKAGIFEFRHKDILLMPYYEPFMWGFYFTALKRFIAGSRKSPAFEMKSLIGLLATSIAFSLFSKTSLFFAATIVSTLLLFVLFHRKLDIAYAVSALLLGFVVELFGVFSGLWSYPAPDFLRMPYWFSTMWISVGLLGGRFLMPLGDWLERWTSPQGA
jgi:hypothetical protein